MAHNYIREKASHGLLRNRWQKSQKKTETHNYYVLISYICTYKQYKLWILNSH